MRDPPADLRRLARDDAQVAARKERKKATRVLKRLNTLDKKVEQKKKMPGHSAAKEKAEVRGRATLRLRLGGPLRCATEHAPNRVAAGLRHGAGRLWLLALRVHPGRACAAWGLPSASAKAAGADGTQAARARCI